MTTLTRSTAFPRWMETASGSLPARLAVAVGATVLVALAAHVSVPLPFSPVPLTLQPFAVLLVGMLLGPVAGFATMVLYLGEGAAGLPVFSPVGPGGVAQMLGPTGGYLMSYPLAAAAAGWLARSLPVRHSVGRGLVAAACATAIIFFFGATWLGTLLHLHVNAALHLAVLPFLPGEAIKIVAAALLYGAVLPVREGRSASPPKPI